MQPGPASTQELARSSSASLRQLSPLLVWAVVFSDIGTSIYYVPGILYQQVGDAAPLFILVALVGFVLLASKYVEICWRHPEGGGVVTVASEVFSPRMGLLGGLLISVSYFVTSAISSLSGVVYLSSLFPILEQHVVGITVLALVLLAAVNIVGIRESALLALVMAATAFTVNIGVMLVVMLRIGPSEWGHMFGQLLGRMFDGDGLTTRNLLIGYSGAWLAFSGLESISQLSPAMKLPIRTTARKGMWFVVGSILLTSPLLTLFSVELLDLAVKSDTLKQERFISELANLWGGLPLQVAVVASASSLLLFAANTAIIGAYHVFLALADAHFLPELVTWRNRRFGTPHFAILVATVVPILLVLATGRDLVMLGDLYAFGLLGAFLLTSLGLDLVRWRERDRGLKFGLGVFATLMIVVAWFTSLMVKQEATVFGGMLVLIGLLFAIGTQQKWFTDWLYATPMFRRMAHGGDREVRGRAREGRPEILSLAQAEEIVALYPSHTLIGMRSSNDSLLQEAILREKGLGGRNLYVVFVDERAGLFVRAADSTDAVKRAAEVPLLDAVRKAERQGIQLFPIWTVSHNAVEGMVRAAEALGVDAVMVGASQRSAVYHLIRGHIVNGLAKRLPAHIKMVLCG
jgi:amino acid transporter/nucleotide-binding universal stress UspA family protein